MNSLVWSRAPGLVLTTLAANAASAYITLKTAWATRFAIQLDVTYGVAATAGVRLQLIASLNNGTTFDSVGTDDYDWGDPVFVANTRHIRTFKFDVYAPLIKYRVLNLDGAVATLAINTYHSIGE